MLSKPGVAELENKVGNRYEVSLAVAKRAREIAEERLESGDDSITDTVDVASEEIDKGIVTISKESLDIKEELVDDIVDAEKITSKLRSKKKADELSKIAQGLVKDLKIDSDEDYDSDEDNDIEISDDYTDDLEIKDSVEEAEENDFEDFEEE